MGYVNGLRKTAGNIMKRFLIRIFMMYIFFQSSLQPKNGRKIGAGRTIERRFNSRGPSTTDLSELMQRDNALWKIDFRETLNYIYI